MALARALPNLLRRRFDEWIRALPPEEMLRQVWGPTIVLGNTVAAAIGLAFGTWVPFSAPLFELRPWPAIAAYAAPLLLKAGFGRFFERSKAPLALCALLFSFLLQLFCVLLVVGSSVMGAVLFSPWLLTVAAAHGYFYRSGTRYPFVSAATVAAAALGLWLAPSAQHVAVLVVTGVGAAILGVLVGEFTCEVDRGRNDSERLRAALQAQLVWEHSLRADRLAGSLEQVAQWNHDMRNALTTVVCHAKLLAAVAAGTDPTGQAEARSTLDGMKRSLDVVVTGFEELQRLSRFMETTTSPQRVPLTPLAEAIASAARARFPGVEVDLNAPEPSVDVLVYGGAVSAHRMVDNLVVNACEGDGDRAARRVEIAIRPLPGAARIEIRDDGPGFPPHLLEGPARAFSTTKRRGTGLGLHSVEQIVAANRGRMTRSNRPEGGAQVTVELPAETAGQSGEGPAPAPAV